MNQDPTARSGRRGFLKSIGGAAAGGLLAPWGLNLATLTDAVAAEGDDYKALVCLFLDGGNDASNTVVGYDPAQHGRYAAIRGTGSTPIAITRDALAGTVLTPRMAGADGLQFALHPQMRGMAQLFNQGHAAVLFNVGPLIVPLTRQQALSGDPRISVPPKLFSHNDQRSTAQSSSPEGATSGYGGGMGDVFLASNGTPLLSSISVASGNAVFLSGNEVAPYQMTEGGAVPISPAVIERGPAPSALAQLLQARRSHVLEDAYAQVLRFSMATEAVVSSALGDYRPQGASRLSNQLRLVVQVAAARAALGMRRQVFYVRHGPYDTHGGQTAQHARLMGELSGAVADFHGASTAAGLADKLTLFTASEFGRTLVSNGDGTDHGWGGHHFIVGGAVKGASFYGQPPPLSVGNSSAPEDQWHVGQGRLLPSTSVAQYMATLAAWFGVPASRLAEVVPDLGNFGAAAGRPDYPIDLGFMR